MSQADSPPRTVDDLCRVEARGGRLKFVFFWGHQPQRDGSVGAGCLSQWWSASFAVDGIGYATAEHFMMERKARLFGDADVARGFWPRPIPGQPRRSVGRSGVSTRNLRSR